MYKLLKQALNAALLIAALTFSSNVFAQVTIGSDKAAAAGAILDLKQGEDLGVNSTKGMLLPRVIITDETSLKDINPNDGIRPNPEEHTGLVVYSPFLCSPQGAGVYAWNGSKWDILTNPQNGSESAIYNPNTYMMPSTPGTLSIPVEKAFAIWEYYASHNGRNRLPMVDLSGNMTTSTLWQDGTIVGTPTLSGADRKANIIVAIIGNKGNATINLKIDGKVRWTWHVWVTDDAVTQPIEGETIGGEIWMNRNLGAISSTPGNPGTKGLQYQYGRNVPIPTRLQDWTDNLPQPLVGGEITDITIKEIRELEGGTNDSDIVNLDYFQKRLASIIENPQLYAEGNTQGGFYDWYCDEHMWPLREDLDNWHTVKAFRWEYRWTADECGVFEKTPLDPCPDGWRLPHLEKDGSVDPVSPLSALKLDNVIGAFNNGYTWPGIGYVPAAGYRVFDGEFDDWGARQIQDTGTKGVLRVDDESTYQRKPFSLANGQVPTNIGSYLVSVSGRPIRCVKYDKRK